MTKTYWIAALAALTLGACEEQPRERNRWGPLPPAQGQEQPPARVDTAFMEGEWRLATLGAWSPPSGTPSVNINITADRIEARSDCKRYAWTYTLTAQNFDAAEAETAEPSCERTGTYWEQAFAETISRANSAEMQGDGGLLIKGAGGEVELKP